jgi:hypothetical protein
VAKVQVQTSHVMMSQESQETHHVPESFEEAMASTDADMWREAMRVEIESLMSNNTWELTDLPVGRKAIDGKWVFKIKYNEHGQVERYKARYVAKGFSQRPGQDFDETFSPVPRAETIRTVLALAVEQGLELDYADFETAFLNSKLSDHEVYMKQPHGFDDHSGRVCLLSKAIYGLKQASREWNKEVTSMFSTLQYQQCKSDPCVYVKRQEKNLCIGVLWVDDLITAANDKKMRQDLIAGLSSRYKLKDKGELTWFLKLRVVYSKEAGVLTIDQGKYLSELMERFNMKSCGPKSTPQAPGVILTKQDAPRTLEENAKMSHTPYKEAVGCLLYSSYWTRPDTANATRDVSRMMACAGEAHWQAVKHILC